MTRKEFGDVETNNGYKIVCEHISKTFIQKGTQRVHVLDDVSVSVKENEFVVILGPGQSGKSTLLRIIAGLETPSEGRVLLDGREVTGPGPDRGLVFQSYMLFPWKTVMGNVELGPKLRGVRKKERRRLIRAGRRTPSLNSVRNGVYEAGALALLRLRSCGHYHPGRSQETIVHEVSLLYFGND